MDIKEFKNIPSYSIIFQKEVQVPCLCKKKQKLKAVAVKGNNDFAIYIDDDLDISYESICSFGNKLFNKKAIKYLMKCDNNFIDKYYRF